MDDELQQLKGFIGQQLALLHLINIMQYEIIGEEVKVEGLNGRSRLDIVARDNDNNNNRNIPIEVKFQQYNIYNYGGAFEHVLQTIGNGGVPVALLGDIEYPLTNPLIYIWYPPANNIQNNIPFYNNLTVITFEQVINELNAHNIGYVNEISNVFTDKINQFFNNGNPAQLNQNQRDRFNELFNINNI